MNPSPFRDTRSVVFTAMVCAGGLTALFIAGKATRDALYLAHLAVTSLPAMVIATAVVSIGLVALSSMALRRVAPSTFVPLLFVASAVLLLSDWLLLQIAPRAAAVLVYLQISGVGPMLGSGFWLIATERFDLRTAKKHFGQIAGAGTLGGLLGGVVAERVGVIFGVAAMLPVLAGLTLFCAWFVRQLGSDHNVAGSFGADVAPELAAEAPRSGLRVLREAPYLRTLAVLVLLGTISAALIDYVFRAQAVATFGNGDRLIRFFALFYAIVSLATFVLQTVTSRFALDKLGLAAATGSPSLAVVAGGIGGLLAPGLGSAIAARGGESMLRASFYRSGYELLYSPMDRTEKRAAKSLLDVGVDRAGDALGGGIVQLVLVFLPMQRTAAILSVAIACSALALLMASRVQRAYHATVKKRLVERAVELDLPPVEDLTTQTMMLHTVAGTAFGEPAVRVNPAPPATRQTSIPATALDPDTLAILALKSRDRIRVLAALKRGDRLPASLVSHVIPLLAWDEIAPTAVEALRVVADDRTGQLIDALIDPNQPFAVRRRLARVFSTCTSQRTADGLMLGLADQRFEVRVQCGRSLAAVSKNNPRVRVDQQQIYDIVLREVTVGRPVWEGRRLLDQFDDHDERDEFVKVRTSQSLTHIFTLLSLVLPTEPLDLAYRGLHTLDPVTRGFALEYLENVLPAAVREHLWPFLDDPRPVSRSSRTREEILEDLLQSNASIVLNIGPWRTKKD